MMVITRWAHLSFIHQSSLTNHSKVLKQTTSLAHAQHAVRISNWLKFYPDNLLTAEDFLFLTFTHRILINKKGFDENAILQGPWSTAYKSLIDQGKLQLINFNLDSIYFTKRFKDIKNDQKFHDPNDHFYIDLSSLIYCDQHDIPITFEYDDLFNRDTATDREGLNFFSNFARSFIEYSDFIEKKYENGLVEFTGRTEFLLSFMFTFEPPKIRTNNTKKIIDDLRINLDPVYNRFGSEFQNQISFNEFVVANLPLPIYVNINPKEFLSYCRNSELQQMCHNYQQLQRYIGSSQEFKEYQKENTINKQPIRSHNSWHVQDVRLGHLKYRTHIPRLNHYDQNLLFNKRILGNAQYLFTQLHFAPTLDSIVSGNDT